MRLWTLHPKYLDPQGLVALWREALLAKAVLSGATRGYKEHPQLDRFKTHPSPIDAINLFLAAVFIEAAARGYSFDRSKFDDVSGTPLIATAAGQLLFEWQHLLGKLSHRNPAVFEKWRHITAPENHPLFIVKPGPIEPWERGAVGRS